MQRRGTGSRAAGARAGGGGRLRPVGPWLPAGGDTVGNVLNIVDYKVTGGTQSQTFGYDHLDRLLTANTAGGSAGRRIATVSSAT